MATLSAKQLSKSFSGRQVVKSSSLEISSGEIVGLLGPNGAGKTTSFYMIVGLVSHDSGHIYLNQQDISDFPMHRRAQMGIGYLPQEASIFRKLTVAENIYAIIQLRSDINTLQKQQLLEQLLQDFKIDNIRESLGQALSGGERRRVEIARALAMNPKFILLDEPFAGIDPISVIDIQAIIHQLAKRGIGVLITDHNVRETLGICEHAYIFNQGEVIAKGSPEDILTDEKVLRVYLGQDFKL